MQLLLVQLQIHAWIVQLELLMLFQVQILHPCVYHVLLELQVLLLELDRVLHVVLEHFQ